MKRNLKFHGKRAGVLALAFLIGTGSAVNTGMTFAESTGSYINEVKAAEASSQQVINGTTVWKYLDDNTDPSTGLSSAGAWTTKDFNDSAWKSAAGKFGSKNGALKTFGGVTPDVLLNQYIDGQAAPDVPTYFFRTTFNVENIDELTSITGSLIHDDAVVVYLNGQQILSVDLVNNNAEYSVTDREGEPNMYYAGVSAGDPKTSTISLTKDQLTGLAVEGENVLAVELHNDRPSSSDLYLEFADLTLNYNEESAEEGDGDTGEDESTVTQKSVLLTLGSDASSRNITWYADSADAGKVQYAPKAGEEFPTEYAEAEAVSLAANEEGFYSNQATLTGLSANTEYVYRVVNGEAVSETYSFKTGDTGAFTFALVGDPQIGASGNAASDTTNWGLTVDTIVNSLNPDFMLSAGDQVNTASSESEYAGYLDEAFASLASVTTIGNHDSGSNAYGQHINLPNESSAYGTTNAGGDYWFVYNNTLFMGLNSNDTSTAEHKAFMQEAIAANPDVTWKTVFFHHSIYSTASHYNNSDIITRRNDLPPVFEELDIDVVLMGHDHVYTRSKIMDGVTVTDQGTESEVYNPDGILYLTANSASGSKYYGLQQGAVDMGYAAKYDQSKRRTVTDVTVTDTSYTMTTYFADTMDVLDTYTIYKTDDAEDTDDTDDTETSSALIDETTTWKYLDTNVDPGTSEDLQNWTKEEYDDSSWKSAAGTFGAKGGKLAALGKDDDGNPGQTPDNLLTQYTGETTSSGSKIVIPTYFFRTTFDVNTDEIEEGATVKGTVTYDDGAIVYLNGEVVAYLGTAASDVSTETNMYYIVDGAGNTGSGPAAAGTFSINADKLKEGTNVLAVEVHQKGNTSSDVFFGMDSLKMEVEDTSSVTQKSVLLTLGSDATERNITWYADVTTAGKVQYAPKAGEEFPAEYTEVKAASAAANDEGFYSNQATLTGLSANTEYVYRVVNGKTTSETYTFKTGDTGTFTFALVGDPQIGASGDAASDTTNWGLTLNTIVNDLNPDFMLSAGDQVNTASSETQYAGYLNDVLSSLASATTIGNHDSGSDSYGEHFNLPNESTELGTTAAGGDYWFVYNNTLFMGLNSNDTSTAEHKAFMQEAIAANPDVTWKTVFFHHSIYSTAGHWDDSDIITRRNELPAVFDELDIDVVLMGHDHIYTRSYMMNVGTPDTSEGVQSEVYNPTGILYLTANSASGSKYYDVANAEAEYSAVMDQSRRRTVTDVTVTDNSYTLTTYFADTMDQLDTFTIYKTDKTELKAAIDSAAEFIEADYTAESWAVLETALEAANTVYDNENATQEAIDEATANLVAAIEALEEVTTTPDGDEGNDNTDDGNQDGDQDTDVDDGSQDGDQDTDVDDGSQDGDQNDDENNAGQDDSNAGSDQNGSGTNNEQNNNSSAGNAQDSNNTNNTQNGSNKNTAASTATTNSAASSTVKTGDTTNVFVWALLMVGASGIVVLIYKKRKA
ncbi:MAG: metallophosphoesterase [Ruminococcus sp.]|nr:metallophosphoesterase [Ruminococcus sp.]